MGLIAVLNHGACHRVEAFERPPNANAKAVLLVLGEGSRALAVRAVDPAQDDWPPFFATEGTVLYALSFSCPLERLNIAPGVQALTDSRSSTPLTPPPAAIYETPAGVQPAEKWTASAAMPPAVTDALDRLPIPVESRCHAVAPRYAASEVSLDRADDRGPPAFGITLSDGRAFVGTRNDRHFLIELDGTTTRLPPRDVDKRFRGGVRAPDGTLWMVGDRGAVWRGSPDEGFSLVTTTTSPFALADVRMVVVGPTDNSPWELFEAGETDRTDHNPEPDTRGRTFRRFDGANWTDIAIIEPNVEIFLPSVTWLGPRHAIAIGVHTEVNSVTRYRDGTRTDEVLPNADGPATIATHPQLGALVGRDATGIARFVDGRWEAMAGVLPIRFVRVIRPDGDGFMYVGSPEFNFSSSAFSYYYPSIGFCETDDRYIEFATGNVVTLGDDKLAVLTASGFSATMGITILRQIQARGSCSEAE